MASIVGLRTNTNTDILDNNREHKLTFLYCFGVSVMLVHLESSMSTVDADVVLINASTIVCQSKPDWIAILFRVQIRPQSREIILFEKITAAKNASEASFVEHFVSCVILRACVQLMCMCVCFISYIV